MKRRSLLALPLAVLALSQGRADDDRAKEAAPASPIASPWDANAWEAGSGKAFWRSPTANTDSGNASASAAPAPSAPKPQAPDFSRRQTEK